MTLSHATFLLAIITAISAFFIALSSIFTGLAASATRQLAEHNKDLVMQNKSLVNKNDELIRQTERQHRERLRPLCFAMTSQDNDIRDFRDVMINPVFTNRLPTSHSLINIRFYNKGLGPATNLRFHINNIENQRITKDFMVAHVLPPNGKYDFPSEIPPITIHDANGKLIFEMSPAQVVHDAYFIVCEYESIFSGDTFHSIVAKGYLDPSLAGDGKNQWRLNRPITPPVEFEPGLDPSKPIWPIPPDDVSYPGEFLNFPSTTEKEHTS
jgi:hypothetical protein